MARCTAPFAWLVLTSAIALAACNTDGPADFGDVDFAGADLTGVDLTGFPGGDMAGAAMVMPVTSVTIIVEPGDDAAMLLAAINGAATSVHMTMYQLTSARVVTALKGRKAAGKEVKVLLNKDFPSGMGSNAAVLSDLMSAGIDVKYAPSTFQYTHEKTVIIDNTTAYIMTMNASESAFNGNREFVAIDTDPADVAEAEAIFQADFANTPITPTGKLLVAPVNAEPLLIALIDGATKTVDLEGEVLSADSILQALGRAKKRGCTVRCVISDQTPTSAGGVAITELKQVGIPIRSLSTPYIHSKAIVTDGTLAYVGSENFTQNSLESNRELGLVVGKKSEVDKVAAAISSDFAAGTDL